MSRHLAPDVSDIPSFSASSGNRSLRRDPYAGPPDKYLYFNYPGCPEVARPAIPTKVSLRKVDFAFIYADPLVNSSEKEYEAGDL